MAVAIDALTSQDTPWVMRLVEAAGWNQTPRDWQRMIDYQPHGCFKAVLNEQGVGTVTTTAYGTSLGWIGMMLVAPECRRAGIGTALMQRAIQYLVGLRISSIYLDATPLGQPLYEKLGFQSEFVFQRWRRESDQAQPSVHAHDDNLMEPAVTLEDTTQELDRVAFGVDRRAWLERLAADSCLVTSPEGYGMLRKGRIASYLGPVVASSPKDAARLIARLLAAVSEPVIWDIPAENHAIEPLARSFGFAPVRSLTRMWHSAPLAGVQRQLQFALSDPATG